MHRADAALKFEMLLKIRSPKDTTSDAYLPPKIPKVGTYLGRYLDTRKAHVNRYLPRYCLPSSLEVLYNTKQGGSRDVQRMHLLSASPHST